MGENAVRMSINRSRTLRRLAGLGGSCLLALAALSTPAAVTAGATAVPAGSVTNATAALVAYRVQAGDHSSFGWTNLPESAGGTSVDPNTDCSSLTQDSTSIPQCNAASTPQPGAVSGATDPLPAPIVIVPAPSQSSVLPPVTPPLPSVGTVTAGVGGAPPWTWFAVLAILDLGLVGAIVVRRRLAQRKRLSAQ
jgi:hypothetical protein